MFLCDIDHFIHTHTHTHTQKWKKNENENENEKKLFFNIVNNSTNFDILAVIISPKPLCVTLLQHFND